MTRKSPFSELFLLCTYGIPYMSPYSWKFKEYAKVYTISYPTISTHSNAEFVGNPSYCPKPSLTRVHIPLWDDRWRITSLPPSPRSPVLGLLVSLTTTTTTTNPQFTLAFWWTPYCTGYTSSQRAEQARKSTLLFRNGSTMCFNL